MIPVTKKNNFHYNTQLQPLANQLRKTMTKAEACLWNYVLRAGSLQGYYFRRQRPILNYIADFVCFELMLVIEIDGSTHAYEGAMEKDLQKDKDLQQVGFAVLRFSNEMVLSRMPEVVSCLENWVEIAEKSGNDRFPPPARQRGQGVDI